MLGDVAGVDEAIWRRRLIPAPAHAAGAELTGAASHRGHGLPRAGVFLDDPLIERFLRISDRRGIAQVILGRQAVFFDERRRLHALHPAGTASGQTEDHGPGPQANPCPAHGTSPRETTKGGQSPNAAGPGTIAERRSGSRARNPVSWRNRVSGGVGYLPAFALAKRSPTTFQLTTFHQAST